MKNTSVRATNATAAKEKSSEKWRTFRLDEHTDLLWLGDLAIYAGSATPVCLQNATMCSTLREQHGLARVITITHDLE